MPTRTRKQVRLTQRDLQILAHVKQYRMTTVDALHATCFLGRGRDAVKSTLRRLYGTPPRYLYLRPESLDARRVYYRLTARGARVIGASKDSARPLGLQARYERYALLWLTCIDQPGRRSLVDPRNLLKDQPSGTRLPHRHFYVDQVAPDTLHLAHLIVDHRADSRRLVRKACTKLDRFLHRGWFNDFVLTGAFALTVLTASEDKRRLLERGLQRRLPEFLEPHARRLGLPDGQLSIHVSVIVVPDLNDVLPFS